MIESIYAAFKRSSGICTDTRKIADNKLFVAIKGPNFNANDFALEAINQGCSAALVDEPRPEFINNERIFVVDDSLEALQTLAHHHRRKLKIPIIGLTGSNGKTTTKELMKAVLSMQYHCYATFGNLNNHIGVPLSLLEITSNHEIAIIEMGANHQKEIAGLCEIAAPDYGLITNIGLAHLEGFGGEHGVYLGKKELFDFLRANEGYAFVNHDDAKVKKAAEGLKLSSYGSDAGATYHGAGTVNNGLLKIVWQKANLDESFEIQTQLTGLYNFQNAMAAIAVGRYFGVKSKDINEALSSFQPTNHRSQLTTTDRGNVVIVDCFNANPSSMAAAIHNLSEFKRDKAPMVILGDMKEVGDQTAAAHQAVIDQLVSSKIDSAWLIGPAFSSSRTPDHFRKFNDTAAALSALETAVISERTILLKASRSMQLEQLLPAL